MFRYDDKADREAYFNSLQKTKSIVTRNFQPIIKLQFQNSLHPPIPVSILNYIIETSNHDVLEKLYQTCKYFFVKKLILICHQLYVSKTFEETFIKNSCATNFSTLNNHSFIEKFCCKILIFHDWEIRTYLSAALPKICFCSVECIQIGGQDLTMDEFLIIIGSGKIEQVKLTNVKVFKPEGNILVIEEIIELLPTVVDFDFHQIPLEMYTPETAENLASLDRSMNKFESFELAQIPENFDFPWFAIFIKKKMIPKANVVFKLRPDVGEDFRNEVEHFCKTVRLAWDPIYEAPRIQLY